MKEFEQALYMEQFGGPKVDEVIKRIECQIIADLYNEKIKPVLRLPGLVCKVRQLFVPVVHYPVPETALRDLGNEFYMTDLLGNPMWRFKFYKGKYYNYGPVLPPEY